MDFAELYKTDVSEQVEKKGQFNYLSWPYAVAEFRKHCPNGTWEIRHFDDKPYCITDAGCFVEVTVFPEGNQQGFTQVHPVIDNRNKTIETPNAFQVNTSIQRCLVKAIALATGIGLYIYAGEDLPEDPKKTKNETNMEQADISATFTDEIDKLESVKEFEEWWRKNAPRANKQLNDEWFRKLGQYYGQAKQVFATKEANDHTTG